MIPSSQALSYATFIYALASVCYIGFWSFKKNSLAKAGLAVLAIAFFLNSYGIIMRWIESYQLGFGHAPFSNMYESLVFFAWTVAALYIFVECKYKEPVIGVFATPLMFLAMAYASFDPDMNSAISPLIPALKSNWLIAHVITCFLGYAGFAIGFGFSIMYLIRPEQDGNSFILSRLPSLDLIDELTYQMIVFGFLFLTIGIITGAVWANSAWGTYWSWDPKETWSLITWIIYAVLLHLRLMRGWQGKRISWMSIAGFICVLFTYFGVNYLLVGLHSYA